MEKEEEKDSQSPWRHAIRSGLKVVVGIIVLAIFAYAIFITRINLEEPQDPQRQATTTRVIRELAKPDIVEFEKNARRMDISVRIPCPENPEEIRGSQWSLSDGRTATLNPNCASNTQENLVLEGVGFRPRTDGLLRWYPPGVVETTRQVTEFRTDADGNFSVEFTMPGIRETEEPQRLEIEEQWVIGIAGFTSTAALTWEKIWETIFLALIATFVGTLLAVPLSFIAAQNIMARIGAPLAAIAWSIIALAGGYFVGNWFVSQLVSVAISIGDQSTIITIGAGIAAAAFCWLIVSIGPPLFPEESQSTTRNVVSYLRILLSFALYFLAIAIIATLGRDFGLWLGDQVDWLGNFVFLISESILVLSPGVIGFLVALLATILVGKLVEEAIVRFSPTQARILTLVSVAAGSFVLVYAIGSIIAWLYQPDNPEYFTLYPAIIIGVLLALASLFVQPKKHFAIGLVLYYITRTILNVTRSIEPLIYVIVFAVWVGIGPFAGVLALTIHTVAALGKLFSEQVEGIMEGPVEAVTATGANTIQTIVFSVIPQIVPPYIAFTLYRWDINVRFSTVIGFAGGGGIGFVLVQNINLLRYSQAAVMMLAIAIVVMTLDFISSYIRNRIN